MALLGSINLALCDVPHFSIDLWIVTFGGKSSPQRNRSAKNWSASTVAKLLGDLFYELVALTYNLVKNSLAVSWAL
jgi:hypothetical protein